MPAVAVVEMVVVMDGACGGADDSEGDGGDGGAVTLYGWRLPGYRADH